MKLSEYIRLNITDCFAAIPTDKCRGAVTRLIADAPCPLYAVMMAVPYPCAERGPLASFARIPDYHRFFVSFEEKISSLLKERYDDVYVRIFTDHSPIDERDAAVRAGLGVKGDNGLFISEKYGSFVFLGEIVCSLTEEQLANEGVPTVCTEPGECLHCGECAAACPAGCIGGDKSHCVSALTQRKGQISDTEADIIKMSGYAWGCDICALVCPMNDGVEATYNKFFTSGTIDPVTYADVDAMSDEEYGKYPFSWRKKEVLRRNFDIVEKRSKESKND